MVRCCWLGFLLLCKTRMENPLPHALHGWAYPLNYARRDSSHWMMLYYENERHYQLAWLRTGFDQPYRCIFTTEELAAEMPLRELYRLNNNRAPLGQDSERVEDLS